MAAKNLSTAEMLGLCKSWLEGERHRGAFERSGLLRGVVPHLEAVHRVLLAAQGGGATEDEASLRALQEKLAELDAEYDRLARGVHRQLEASELLARTPGEREALAATRAKLFPEGLSLTQGTYLAQAGSAATVDALLSSDPALRERLSALPGGSERVSLESVLRRWVKTGQRLGALESERVALRARVQGEPSSATEPSALVRARNQFVRVANVLRANAPLLEGDELEAVTGALRELDAAEDRADARVAARANRAAASDDGDDGEAKPAEGGSKPPAG